MVSVKHATLTAELPAQSKVSSSQWDAEHDITGLLPTYATVAAAKLASPPVAESVSILGRDNSVWAPTALDLPGGYAAGEDVWWYEDAAGTIRAIAERPISITHLGAVGDSGTTDCTTAWRQMEYACSVLDAEAKVPKAAGYFKVTHPLYAWDGGTLRMAGRIRNTRTSNVSYGDHFCILIGNCTGSTMANATKYTVTGSIAIGATSFTVSSTDGAQFAVGDPLWIYDSDAAALADHGAAGDRALSADFNEVKSKQTVGATTTITTTYPFKEAIGGSPKVINLFATGDNGAWLSRTARAVKDFTIVDEGGSFASDYERWTGGGGMLRCKIQAYIEKTSNIFSVNAVAYSDIDVSGHFSWGGFEIAYFSQDSHFSAKRGISHDGTSTGSHSAMIWANELARRISFDDIHGAAGPNYNPSYLVLSTCPQTYFGGNIHLQAANTQVSAVDVYAIDIGTVAGTRFLPGSTYRVDATLNGIRIAQTGTAKIADLMMTGISVFGTFSSLGMSLKGDDVVIRNVYHESGNVTIQSGANRVMVDGCERAYSAGEPTITDSGTNSMVARSYRRTLGRKVAGRRIIAVLLDDTATSFVLPYSVFRVNWSVGGSTSEQGTVVGNTASPSCATVTGTGASVAATTGALTGTDGTDARLNVSAHTDGKIYFENRLGGTRTLAIDLGDG